MIKQINDNGIPLVNGLDVFIPVITFGDERLSFNDSFSSDTLPRTSLSTNTSAYATEAVSGAGLPAFKNSNWFTYGTSGVAYPSIETRIPTSDNNKITISAVVDAETFTSSHSGIFQEMKHLIPENEYRVTINLTNQTTLGTISVSRIYNVPPLLLTQSNVTEFAVAPTASQIVMDFKAYSPSDIIFIDYSSTVSLNNAVISSIYIKEKNQYNTPVIVTSPLTGSSIVLARQYNSSIPLDEGQPA
tara:strand:- start:56 stop:790 length:735 start_codon:yes stop_codon:yes gene_type:complete